MTRRSGLAIAVAFGAVGVASGALRIAMDEASRRSRFVDEVVIAVAAITAVVLARAQARAPFSYDRRAHIAHACSGWLFFVGVLLLATARDRLSASAAAVTINIGWIAVAWSRRAVFAWPEWLGRVAETSVPGWRVMHRQSGAEPSALPPLLRTRDPGLLDGVLVATVDPASPHYRDERRTRSVALAPLEPKSARDEIRRSLRSTGIAWRAMASVLATVAFGLRSPSTALRRAPKAPTSAVDRTYVAIALGGDRSCAIDAAGDVRCWGRGYGPIPMRIEGVSHAHAIAVGERHACVILTDGSARCWGDNERGQLGDGTAQRSSTVVEVRALRGVTTIAVGGAHTCASTRSQQAYCWGANEHGQLGDGTRTDRYRPVPVALDDVTAIAAGDTHSCALHGDGAQQASCWGDNARGQLGDGGRTSNVTPGGVRGLGGSGTLAGGDRIVARGAATCVRQTDGDVLCWGEVPGVPWFDDGVHLDAQPIEIVARLGSDESREGDGRIHAMTSPTEGFWWITSDEVVLGDGSGCVRTAALDVRCWGWVADGGAVASAGRTSGSPNPERMTGLEPRIAHVAVGAHHACALDTDGGVRCWGRNDVGQLGQSVADVRIAAATADR